MVHALYAIRSHYNVLFFVTFNGVHFLRKKSVTMTAKKEGDFDCPLVNQSNGQRVRERRLILLMSFFSFPQAPCIDNVV